MFTGGAVCVAQKFYLREVGSGVVRHLSMMLAAALEFEFLFQSQFTAVPDKRWAAFFYDETERKKALKWSSLLWTALYLLETGMHGSSKLIAFHLALLWPYNVWTREHFVAQFECKWEGIPPRALRELMMYHLIRPTTKTSEDLFNLGRRVMRGNPGTKNKETTFYHRCRAEPLLDEADHIQVPITDNDRKRTVCG